MSKIIAIIPLLLGLTACSEVIDRLLYYPHAHPHRHIVKKHYAPLPPQPEVQAPHARTETHDEMVERVHREAAQRRLEYCNNHPNLAVRIGCN
jgi:hypothetical protein